MTIPRFEFSDRYRRSGLAIPFGLAVVTGVNWAASTSDVNAAAKRATRELKDDGGLRNATIEKYNEFFSLNGAVCPLVAQLDRVKKGGFPRSRLWVTTLMVAELKTGVLMGIQDGERIDGGLCYDLASSGESFRGMREEIHCVNGEMILRDDSGIVASYFQGPDARTEVTEQTRDVVFYAFGAPGVEAGQLLLALSSAVEILKGSGRSADSKVFESGIAG